MTPINYVRNLEAHSNATCFCSGGVILLRYNNKYYTYREFYEAFPIHPVAVRVDNYMKGENPDKTKSWMVI